MPAMANTNTSEAETMSMPATLKEQLQKSTPASGESLSDIYPSTTDSVEDGSFRQDIPPSSLLEEDPGEASRDEKVKEGGGDDPSQDVVEEFVEEVISKAAFTAGVSSEKERVQSLIFDLVDRVRKEGNESRSQPQSVEAVQHSSEASQGASDSASSVVGVPYGDVRAYCVPCGEIGGVRDMFWVQSSETLTLTLVLDVQPPPTSARDIRVVFESATITVYAHGTLLLSEKTHMALCADGCLWSLDRSDSRFPSLTLELEKSRTGWWPLLFAAHNPNAYSIYRPPASSAVEPPPPPAPQTAPFAPNVDAPPPDVPPPSAEEASVSKPLVASGEDVFAFGGNTDGPKERAGDSSVSAGRKAPPSRQDIDAIVRQYRTAYEKQGPGAAEAALQLGTFYHHGIGVERNDAEAARLYRFAMERGVVDNLAAFQLGLIYNTGCPGLEADPKEAVRWWLVSAKLGNAVAMFNLGVMFMKGSGCTMDPNIALQFFRQAEAINPRLKPPELSKAQLAERVAQASRLKKRKQKADLTDEERQRRQEQAEETLRYAMYGTAAVVTSSITLLLLRNWWRNRL